MFAGVCVPVAVGLELPLDFSIDLRNLVAALPQGDCLPRRAIVGAVHKCVVGRRDVRDAVVGFEVYERQLVPLLGAKK